VIERVWSLARQPTTFLRASPSLSTHDPGQAFACATDAALLHRGTLRAIGPPTEVIEPDRLAEVYGVRVSVACLPTGAWCARPS
jgi:iron complex transport system ATP-binding protein